MKKSKTKIIIASALILALILFFALAGFFTDLLWFKELGYVSVFFTELVAQLKFGVPVFLGVGGICFFYLMVIKRNYYKRLGACERTSSEKSINWIAGLLSLAFALLAAVSIAKQLWFQLLQFTNSTDFGIADPIFNNDVSFYIFKLEFLQRLNGLLIGLVIGFAVVNVLYYLALLAKRRPQLFAREENEAGQSSQNPFSQFSPFGGFEMPGSVPKFNKNTAGNLLKVAGTQLVVLGVLFFLLLALHFYLKQFTLLYTSSSGVVFGAGFTDIKIYLWVYRLQVALSLAAALLVALSLKKGKIKRILLAPAAMVALGVLGVFAAALVQNLVVEPDELNKERAYLENNIAFTRYAYDLQDIRTEDYDIQYNLSAADIENNLETITNIRINDYEPALKYYNQTQSIRLYYNFNDVDVDRYMVNGEYTQTFLSAREIDENAINQQWLTAHLKYTHGYGVTLSRVDTVSESGQPAMLIDSIPPVSQVPEIEITRPEIYFGEDTNNYVIVNTNEPEFDYPSGESNVYTEYEGNAGIPMSLLNRALFALREGDMQILVSTNIDKDSRILINRNIMQRIQKIAPFLSYDEDPYIVAADGGLYWILDAYTVSSYYPYSEPFGETGINYIRNSVKVVVDAYNGDVSFYIVGAADPIADTLQKIYPALFKDLEEMPESLQAHLRYPNTMFTIQAGVYTKYHMTDVNVFYQNEDGWAVATETYGREQVSMTPTYFIMKLPGETQAEFINSIPYTPSGKNNLTALLVARNDGEHYGELVLYQMPKDRIIYGPQQIEAQINQNTEIAQDFTLWSSAGSTYSRGNMFVIPIGSSLMYVEPIYLESASSSLPEVKKVIIYYNERIAYEDTLTEALNAMFDVDMAALRGESSSEGEEENEQPEPENGAYGLEELAEKANAAYEQALEAQRNGDWAAYGSHLDELAFFLQQMLPEEEAPLAPETEGIEAPLDGERELPVIPE
ncbi:MAG: UPF0182 family protein [Firmicutes bacterium]|nr:UPF0182 family protein [Bacillota bacterium]